MPTIGRHHHGSARGNYPARCSLCGVPWPRGKMVKMPGGSLVCPDDRGPDATTLDRLNARAARSRRRPPTEASDVYVAPHEDPSTILGSILHTWIATDSVADFQTDEYGRVVTWRNRARDNAAYTAIAASLAGRRPFVHGNAFETLPGVGGFHGWSMVELTSFDGFAAGARPYVWLVLRLPVVSTNFNFNYTTMSNAVGLRQVSSDVFRATLTCSDGTDEISGPTLDTNAHLLEACPLSTTAGRFVVDGTSYSGARTGGILSAVTSSSLSTTGSKSFYVGEHVIASEPPSASQITRMRDYFAARFGELDIA